MHEGAVTKNEPVSTCNRLRPPLISHGGNQNKYIDEISERVGQKEQHQPAQTIACHEAPKGPTQTDASIASHARDCRNTMPELWRREHRQ